MRTLREPRAHQREGLTAAAGREAFAFLLAMRLGKTKMTLDEYVGLYNQGRVHDLVVVAPGGVYETWASAIPLDVGPPPEVHVWRSGKGAGEVRRRKAFLANESGRPRALLVNVEALSVVQDARDMLQRFVSQSPVYMVIDEATSVKNPRAKRTKFIVDKIGPLAAYRRILTGLVTPRSPLDLFSQFSFLDWRILGHRSFFTFRSRYGVLRKRYIAGRSFQEVIGYQNLDELQRAVGKYSFRRTLEEVYDMPPSTYQIRHVEMTDEQRRVYEDLKRYATSKLAAESHVTATLVITQMLRLHQVLCGFATDDQTGAIHEVPENRTRALLELLEEHEGKAIVWCSYGFSVEKVSHAIEHGLPRKGKKERERGLTDEEGITDPVNRGFGPGSVARFWGGNRSTREAEEKRFKEDPGCRFLVATPNAGGKGRTWDVADLVIYYSSTNDLELRSQSEERPKGVGKTRSIGYVDLIIRGTVEEKFLAALRTKMDLAGQITGDSWKEWIV